MIRAAILAFAGFIAGFCAAPAFAIVGASVAAEDPALVMVLSRMGGASGFCTAIVLSRTVLLTAGHCARQPSDLRILPPGGDGRRLLEASQVLRHPNYRADAIVARKPSVDLALVRLKEPLPEIFHAAELGPAPENLGAELDMLGFGVTQENAPKSSGALRRMKTILRAPLSNVLLWLEGHGGACGGDSGGPVYSHGRVVGVIAFAAGADLEQCGDLTQAIRLWPYRGWIDSVMQKWSAQ